MNSDGNTQNYPIVKTAQVAFEKGDITPILKWVKKEKVKEIKELFKKTLIVRNQGRESQDIADKYFLETLVRVHLADEGEPYTGLKPAGVVEANKVLETVSVDALVKLITEEATKGIRVRFAKVKEVGKHADHSIEASREYAELCILMLQSIHNIITGRTSIIQSEY